MSPDPSGLTYADPRNPQSMNLYSYALNNPLVFTDPSGLACTGDVASGNIVSGNDPTSGIPTCAQDNPTQSNPVPTVVHANDTVSYYESVNVSAAYNWSNLSLFVPGNGTDFSKPRAPGNVPAPNNPPQVPHTCQQNRILNAVPGSTLTDPNDTIGTSVGGHSQFGINVTTDQLSAAGFTPFNPFGHADGYHNGNVFFQVHDNGAGGIVTQGHIDVFNPATGLFGFLGHSIVDVGIGTLLQHLFPHSHGLLDPGCWR
jgi:hypothetical protein